MENQAHKQPERRSKLLEQAKEVSANPGVYLMKDGKGHILYVGKAKVLPNRLTSYFQGTEHEIPRIELLVRQIDHFDVILTETESEALILEATLIKKHKPKFNIRLKDDKAYPYLKIQMKDPFPRIEWTRRVLNDGAQYFGPFPSAWAARGVLQLLNETLRLRDCSDNTFLHRSRACILYQMDRCTAPCVQKVDAQGYRGQIDQAAQILGGQAGDLLRGLRESMVAASEKEEFEAAAELRDQIQNLEIVTQTQGAVEAGVQRDRDVFGLALGSGGKESFAHGTLLRVRGGKLISVQHYQFQNVVQNVNFEEANEEQNQSELLFDFISQHYLSGPLKNGAAREGEPPPRELLVPFAPLDIGVLEKTLNIGIHFSENATDEQLLRVAQTNAQYALEQSVARDRSGAHGVVALEEIQKKLHLHTLPSRIECYDISNILGEDAVASRVVFVDGAPEKSLYRRYKIKTVEGANDFAMMKEVLSRRFTGANAAQEDLPELIVVDGGKGQLAQAVAVLEELNVQGVSLAGLAKARTESDFRSSEVKASMERIFIPNRKNPIPLLPHTGAYKLLTHIRDEAHRFAISYHRTLRDKRSMGG